MGGAEQVRGCEILLILGLGLGGCAGVQGQVEEYGGIAFESLEQSSVTFGKGAKRYLCKTIRVEALRELFPTENQRQGLEMMCEDP